MLAKGSRCIIRIRKSGNIVQGRGSRQNRKFEDIPYQEKVQIGLMLLNGVRELYFARVSFWKEKLILVADRVKFGLKI